MLEPRWKRWLATVLVGTCSIACDASPIEAKDRPTAACAEPEVDRFKELVVVDEDVLADSRAKNASSGVWSFRHAVENITPLGADASELVVSWLREGWPAGASFNGYLLDRPRLGETITRPTKEIIVCPWVRRTNPECDATCSNCDLSSKKVDLASAPFRLIAIVNRMDLSSEVEGEPAGEGRLVFALTDGAGDDPAAKPLRMSVIFEYRLPDTRAPMEWASSWHELGKIPTFDETYRAALERVTNGFTRRGANPSATNGSALAQVRTNESALSWVWQLREFGLDANGALRLQGLRNTPPEELNKTQRLADFVLANAAAIRENRFEMPAAMRAGSADQLVFGVERWSMPNVDEATRKAFASNTCNGCHSQEHPPVDSAFHITPFRRGIAKLSTFMNDPGKPDELTRRTESLRRVLCGGE